MSLQTSRSLFERKITTAFSGLAPSVAALFDNVQDEPPSGAANYLNLVQPRD